MQRKPAHIWPGLMWIVLVIAALIAGCSSGATSARPRHSDRLAPPALTGSPPSTFISLRMVGGLDDPEVAVSSSATGATVSELLPATRNGMDVNGLSLDRAGDLWVTYSESKPHNCANEIAVWHAATRKLTVFLRTKNNVLISGAAISPDGKLLAYREIGCATGFFFNSYLRITDVDSRRSWTIGRAIARCHTITNPSWSVDGRDLIVGYAPPPAAHWSGPPDTCLAPQREELLVLNPALSQSGIRGTAASADPGCEITSAAGIANGDEVAVEGCGAGGYIEGPARLLVFDPHLHFVHRIALGRCTDGNELSPDRPGTGVLVSAYLFCNPPGKPGPVTRLWSYTTGGRLRLVTTVPGGYTSISLVTW